MKISIASDHGGFDLKNKIKQYLTSQGHEVRDFGTFTTESCDYPDFAHQLGMAIEAGEVYPGIAICGTGNGISMTLNKHQSVRAALCWSEEIARLAREHNDANVLVMPGRFVANVLAKNLVETFLDTDFEGGRHQRRVGKIPLQK